MASIASEQFFSVATRTDFIGRYKRGETFELLKSVKFQSPVVFICKVTSKGTVEARAQFIEEENNNSPAIPVFEVTLCSR